jgi:hypothetical protein
MSAGIDSKALTRTPTLLDATLTKMWGEEM